jgi:hemoglobin-like flavoprotein
MDPQSIQKARDSLSRCGKDSSFLDRFYEHFMASSEDIRTKFEQTDFERQKKVLSDSLFLMLAAAGTTQGFAHVQLEKLAKRHCRTELDIKPEWYDLWLDTLLKTVAEFDPAYSSEIDAAWRASVKDGIEILIAGY